MLYLYAASDYEPEAKYGVDVDPEAKDGKLNNNNSLPNEEERKKTTPFKTMSDVFGAMRFGSDLTEEEKQHIANVVFQRVEVMGPVIAGGAKGAAHRLELTSNKTVGLRTIHKKPNKTNGSKTNGLPMVS